MPNYKVNNENRHINVNITIEKQLWQNLEKTRGKVSRSRFYEDLLRFGLEKQKEKT